MPKKNFDDHIVLCDRQISQLQQQQAFINRMIETWEKRKKNMLDQQNANP